MNTQSLSKMHHFFFKLIRVAIGREETLSKIPSSEDWNGVYTIAVKQAMLGVCFCGVLRLPKDMLVNLPKDLLLNWFAQAEGCRRRNVLMNQRCVELARLLEGEGLRYAILKGQGVAASYPSNIRLYRQSGDIDVWVDGGMGRVLSFCQDKYGCVDYDYINAHVPVFEDVDVEAHWRVQSMTNLFRNRRLQKWLEREDTKAMISGGKVTLPDGNEIVVPTSDFNAFYLMLHCYNHEFSSGLGLRQLMDYYFLLEKYIEQKESVLDLFHEYGMDRFVSAVMWIMQEVFGVERDKLLCEPNEKEGRYILGEVMEGGNFGHYDNRIKKVGKGKLSSVFAILQHAMHVLFKYPSEALWLPVWMVYHFVWKSISVH